jgi:hypothetical protein
MRGSRLSVTKNPVDERWARDPDRAAQEWRWSLTLDLLLLPHRDRPSEVVLLLDDPTRVFAETQRMRDCLQGRPRVGTLVYTASLPFHVNLQHAEQVLVLSPSGPGPFLKRGRAPTKVRDDLRASLGMTGRSSFRISERNLVVEGTYDVNVIAALSELARRAGEESLPEDLNLIAAGGAREVANVTAFLDGLGLQVFAMLDADPAGRAARLSLLERFADRGKSAPLVLDLGELAGFDGEEGAIEDLFPEAFYLDCVRQACKEEGVVPCSLPQRLPGERKITAELREIFGKAGLHFPKGRAIEVSVRRLGEMTAMEELPAEMLAPVRELLRGLRASAERMSALAVEGR